MSVTGPASGQTCPMVGPWWPRLLALSSRQAEPRDHVGRDPLQHVQLVVAGVVQDELVDARLAVAADDVLERVGRGPRIAAGPGHPVVQRAHDLARVAADL